MVVVNAINLFIFPNITSNGRVTGKMAGPTAKVVPFATI